MEQQIRFCTTPDGVRIAYATIGDGPPLVVVPGWLSHLQFEWQWPKARAFWETLAQRRCVVRFDPRGTGLSDWDAPDLSMDARVRDLEAVVDTVAPEQCELVGISQGGPTSIVYATRHSEKVTRLILYGSYPRMHVSREIADHLPALVRTQWGMGSAALTSIFLPQADPKEIADFSELQRVAATGENAAKMLEEILKIDVTFSLKDIRVPTLVIHRRGDRIHPFDLAREMAALIPDARFHPLEGEVYQPWLGDSKAVLDAIAGFLGLDQWSTPPPGPSIGAGLVTVVFTDVEGSTALTERLGDAKAREVLREHERIVREALRSHGGSEIKAMGDGFMASFSSATRALECAIAMQRAFTEHNETADEPIRLRMGLNAGEPIAEQEDLFGTAVNLAARIAARAEGGEILASDVVRQLVAGKGFLFADRGETALRGFEDPVRLYEVRWER